ncbi:MAG TPA: MFS transporter [Alphaproteobacteria bacterium]|jgi:MFS family permease
MSQAETRGSALASNNFIRRLFLISVVMIVLGTAVQSFFALRIFESELDPAIEGKALAVGRVVAREVNRAVALDIPFGELRGMQEFLVAARADHPEISYIVVGDADGKPVYGSEAALDMAGRNGREFSVPLRLGEEASYGAVRIGIDERYVRGLLGDVAVDIVTVLLVTLLVTFEVLIILAALGIVLPIRAIESLMRDYEGGRFDRRSGMRGGNELARLGRRLDELGGRVATSYAALRADYDALYESLRNHPSWRAVEEAMRDVAGRFSLTRAEERKPLRIADFSHMRAPLVVFILSEELTRSFLPIFIRDFNDSLFGLSPGVVNSLPISFYMLMTAIATPFAGNIVDRIGARRIFLWGCIPGAVGMLGCAFAQGVLDLMLWRGLAAIGYAMSTIAAQAYLTNVAGTTRRVQAAAIYVGAVMLAAICGIAVGGIVAEQIGFRATFAVSGAVAALSALLAYLLLFDPPPDRNAPPVVRAKWRDYGVLLSRPLFGVLMLGVAVPAKIVLTGFLFYLVPLYLSSVGNSQSDIGRAMTAYFIVVAVGTKLVGQVADKYSDRRGFVLLGGLLSGLGPMLLLGYQGFLPVVLVAFAVGIGHALSTSPLVAMVTEVAARETPQVSTAAVLGIFRVLERVGSVLGPVMAAALATFYGYSVAMAGTGVAVLAGTLLFAVVFLLHRSGKGTPA